MGNRRLENLRGAVKKAGVNVTSYSPGDGVTRYRFALGDQDYFAVPHYNRLSTQLGIKNATIYAVGLMDGWIIAQEQEGN